MDTPEFLSSTLHIITFFAVPLHILGTYCILAKTPKSMSSVKWVMFNFHFWCMILDWSLTILTIPFLLFPALAGFPLGVLNEFGVSVAIQVYLIVTLLGVIQTSIIQIFENRFFILFGTKTKWKNYRKLFIACTYIASVTFFIPAVLLVPDQTIGMQIVFEILPDLPHEIRKMPIYVFAIEFRFVVVPVAIMAVSHTIEWYIFFKLISTNMKLSIKTMVHSKNTIGLQKRFIKAMTVQSAAFLLNLQIPVLYMFVCVVGNIYIQAANNLCFIVLSIHGISCTLIMILAHKPYREFFCELFELVGRRRVGNRVSSNMPSQIIEDGRHVSLF